MMQNRANPRPSNVLVDKSTKLVSITWNDGAVSEIAFERLRAACPCAECKSSSANCDPLRQAMMVSTGLHSAEVVGNYAVRFVWDDGHSFGIYTWDYVRSLG